MARLGALLVGLLVCLPAVAEEGFCKQWKWVTVDDFTSPSTSSSAGPVLITPTTAYVAGLSDDGITGHWVVRKSVDKGATWTTVDDFIYSVGLSNHPESITLDPSGNIYVAGGANNLSMSGNWLVRKSTNAGATWNLVDSFADVTVPAASARSIGLDGTGALIVGGESNVPPDGYHWFLRRSTDLGQTWTVRDDLAPIRFSASARGVTVSGAGDLFVAGFNYDGKQYRCQVRRQLAGTTTWTIVDDYQLSTSGACLPRCGAGKDGPPLRRSAGSGWRRDRPLDHSPHHRQWSELDHGR